MPLSFTISDEDLASARVVFLHAKDEQGKPHGAVQVLLEATGPGGTKLPLSSVDPLDACVADGTLTASDRSFLVGLLKKLASRTAKKAGQ